MNKIHKPTGPEIMNTEHAVLAQALKALQDVATGDEERKVKPHID